MIEPQLVNSLFYFFEYFSASFMSKLLMVDGQPIKYQIWDTAGQEKYHSLAPMYYRGAAAAIIVYDITRSSSFQTLKNWVRELQQLGPENIVIAICGNKCDLEDKREVDMMEAKSYADEINALFLETSAKANRNVQELFQDISKRLPAPAEPVFDATMDLKKSSNKDKQSGGCC
jgi:Ras-related protein Rab-22